MSYRKSAVILTGLTLAIMALAPASAPAKEGGTYLPTQGKGTGNSCTTVATGVFHYTGTGTSTHIGKYSWDSVGQGAFTGEGENYAGSGTYTVTAANGATFSGSFTFLSEDATLPVHHDTVNIIIEEGTGRLAGITGEFTETLTLSTYSFDGVTACATTEDRISGWVSLNK